MFTKTAFALTALSLLFAIAPAAHASTFRFEGHNLGHNSHVGKHKNITTTFNPLSHEFKWSSTFSRNTNNGLLAEGGWLVVSDGENPKANVDEYAIFYLDGKNKKVSIYNYDGYNNANSYLSETYLGSTTLKVINNGNDRTFKFSLDASTLNSHPTFTQPDWDGVAFGEKIGLWFHGTEGLTTEYNADGSLKTFTYANQGWHDSKNNRTAKVPEPASAVAIGLFAAAATKCRKRFA